MFEAATSGSVAGEVEDGKYVGKLVDLVVEPSTFDPGKERITWKWHLQMPGTTGVIPDPIDKTVPLEFWTFSPTTMTPKSYARRNCEALLGRPLAQGEQVDPEDLKGRKALLNLQRKDPEGRPFIFSIAPHAEQRTVPVAPDVAERVPSDRESVVSAIRAKAKLGEDTTALEARLDAIETREKAVANREKVASAVGRPSDEEYQKTFGDEGL